MVRSVMEKMAVSEFKATCLAVLQRVKRTGQPVLITRFGEPVARGVLAQEIMTEVEDRLRILLDL